MIQIKVFINHIILLFIIDYLLKFILDLIKIILSNPSLVKWPLDLTISDAYLKSSKSLAFAPYIGYSLKKGIILSTIWEIFHTANVPMPDFSTIEKEPQPKTCTKLSNK